MLISEQELKELLTRKASVSLTDRDDLFGETPDDAYDWGLDDGEVILARQLLKDVFGEEVKSSS